MTKEKIIENTIQQPELKLKEILIKREQLNREYEEVMKELDLTPTQLIESVENIKNSQPEIWEQWQKERKQIEERIELEISLIPNVSKTQEAFSERGKIQSHWLFVR